MSLGSFVVALPFVLFHVYTDAVAVQSIPYVTSFQMHGATTVFPRLATTDRLMGGTTKRFVSAPTLSRRVTPAGKSFHSRAVSPGKARLATTEGLAKRPVHPSESFVKRFPLKGSFVSALTALADADRCIILTMTDKAYTDMAINFYETNLRAHHIHNFLFVGVGRTTCEILTNLSIPCFYYADDPNADTASSFGQQEFNHKVNIRTDMILEALADNFTVIHSDTDVAFLSNPLSALKVGLCLISYSLTCKLNC